MRLRRRLDGIESALIGHPAILAVKYKGSVDGADLKKSYALLCRKHPILMARIVKQHSGHLFEVPEHFLSKVVTYSGNLQTLIDESNTKWSPTESLATLIHVQGTGDGYVALRADHSIVDASSLSALLNELLSLYSLIVAGEDSGTNQQLGPMPSAPSELLKSRWKRAGLTLPPAHPSETTGRNELKEVIENRLTFSQQETAHVVGQAHICGTTVNALVSGAIVIALKELFPSSSQQEIGCRTVIDLRRHVDPRVGPTETTNFIGWHTDRVLIGPGDGPIDVGKRIREGILDGILRGAITLSGSAAMPNLPSWDREMRLAMTSITNAGVMECQTRGDGLEVVDTFALRPRKIAVDCFSKFAIHTVLGSLKIIAFFPQDYFTQSDVDRVIGSIHESLIHKI